MHIEPTLIFDEGLVSRFILLYPVTNILAKLKMIAL